MAVPTSPNPPRLFTFVGSSIGPWAVRAVHTLAGDGLPFAEHMSVLDDAAAPQPGQTAWALRGITSNERYVERHEKTALASVQAGLGLDYAPEQEPAFDDLLAALRSSAEWAYVDREVDIRLVRDGR